MAATQRPSLGGEAFSVVGRAPMGDAPSWRAAQSAAQKRRREEARGAHPKPRARVPKDPEGQRGGDTSTLMYHEMYHDTSA